MIPQVNEQISSRPPLFVCITVVLILYLLQGVTIGIIYAVPVYLASFGATWKQQGTLSFVMYPFSLKLLWAPLIDAFYIRRLGRRQTWLLPVQVLIGIMLIFLSYYIDSLLIEKRVNYLTIILTCIVFLTATQDICVDGWALQLFAGPNIVWQSISQMIGQPFGSFIGSPILLTFESANMTNQLLRQPLGMMTQSYGLFTLAHFVRFWGVAFLIIALVISLFFREQKLSNITDDDLKEDGWNVLEIYLSIVRLFKKKCFRQLVFIIIGSHIGNMATSSMTYLTLISGGLIKRDTLGLITMPLIIVNVSVPFLLTRTTRPLIFFARSYIPRLIVCVFIGLFVLFSYHIYSHRWIFYFLLFLLLALNDGFAYVQGAARGGFFAQISDTRIGGTYYTLLASLNNAGMVVFSSLVLYTADWFPKEPYLIEVIICVIIGIIWFIIAWRIMIKLQALPVHTWHLTLHREKVDGHDQQCETTVSTRNKQELRRVTNDTICSTWF